VSKDNFQDQIEQQARRKLESREQGPWQDLAAFGMVGWSVALPTILGVGMGVWLDRRWPAEYSWTLMLLALGVMIGCANAWWWVEHNR
jgi:ATP synthase protein I